MKLLRKIQKPAWWHMVNTEQIRSHFLDQREISPRLLEISDVEAIGIRCERAVCDTLEKKLLLPFK